jgi:hypothetical protein
MKHLVLTFLSTAAVCAALSAAPAPDAVAGAPAGTAPVTVEGYGNSHGYAGPSSAPAIGAAYSAPASAIAVPERCHASHDFNDADAKITVVCGP